VEKESGGTGSVAHHHRLVAAGKERNRGLKKRCRPGKGGGKRNLLWVAKKGWCGLEGRGGFGLGERYYSPDPLKKKRRKAPTPMQKGKGTEASDLSTCVARKRE